MPRFLKRVEGLLPCWWLAESLCNHSEYVLIWVLFCLFVRFCYHCRGKIIWENNFSSVLSFENLVFDGFSFWSCYIYFDAFLLSTLPIGEFEVWNLTFSLTLPTAKFSKCILEFWEWELFWCELFDKQSL